MKQAKQSDADSAPPSKSSIIPFHGAMQAPSMKAVMDKAISKIKDFSEHNCGWVSHYRVN